MELALSACSDCRFLGCERGRALPFIYRYYVPRDNFITVATAFVPLPREAVSEGRGSLRRNLPSTVLRLILYHVNTR